MDYIIKEYNNPAITRESIAKQCKMYACADDDRILTLPFYSLFEKKYVYLPMSMRISATSKASNNRFPPFRLIW